LKVRLLSRLEKLKISMLQERAASAESEISSLREQIDREWRETGA